MFWDDRRVRVVGAVREPPRRHPPRRTPDTKFPGGHRSRVTPVPIPNTEVKPATADGTACVGAWESRSLPGINNPHAATNAAWGPRDAKRVAEFAIQQPVSS